MEILGGGGWGGGGGGVKGEGGCTSPCTHTALENTVFFIKKICTQNYLLKYQWLLMFSRLNYLDNNSEAVFTELRHSP